MNFEHLFSFFIKNHNKIKDKKKALLFIKSEYKILRLKKEKLKLGKVALEVKEYFMGDIVVFETLEMVFTRQDNTIENELKLENRLKALDWKWDFDNILAFILVITCLFIYIYHDTMVWLDENYPSLINRDERHDALLRFNFYSLYGTGQIVKFETFQVSSYWAFEAICELSIKMNIL